jgi:hypothetical protein
MVVCGIETRLGRWVMAAACMLCAAAAEPAIAGDTTQSLINCDIQKGSCMQTVAGRNVSLEVMPKPVQAMQDLTFRVTVDGPMSISEQPYIDLNMPAMEMGHNRVVLKDLGSGVFEGRGVIVRCRSGLKTWQAKITLPDMGSACFIFDVVY